MRFGRFVFATALLLGTTPLVGTAVAQETHQPDDVCFGIVHFPDDPVDNAPSKIIIGIAVSPEYSFGEFTFELGGASGDQTGMGTIGPDGLGFGEAPLFQYGDHQITGGTLTVPGMDPHLLDFSQVGDAGRVVVDDAEPVCDSTTLTPVAAATTTTTTTTTTTEAPPETTVPPTTVPTEDTPLEEEVVGTIPEDTVPDTIPDDTGSDDTGGGINWPIVLIPGGLLIAGGGLVIARKDKKDCDRERENLAAAQRRLAIIHDPLEEALEDMAEHESEVSSYEAELAGYTKAKTGGSTIENKVRYYAYGGDRISEGEVDTQIEYYEALLAIARKALATAEARVNEWHAKFQKAEQEVREAEEALALCLGEGTAPAPPATPTAPGTAGPSTPTGPSGPAVTTPPPTEERPKKECENNTTYITPSKHHKVERLPQIVDFAVIVEVGEGSERKVGEAKAMSLGLGDAIAGLDIAGKALGARGAAKSITTGLGGMQSGEYVMGGLGLVKGTAEGTMASGLTDVTIPTSPPEAVVEVVKGVAKLGKFVADKVGKWLIANQLYEVHLTLFQQTITATPYDQWVCRDDKWTCRTVWQYSVGQLRKRGKPNIHTFRLDSDIAKHRMKSTISRLGKRAQSETTKSLQDRAKFDAKHTPSNCG